MAVRVITDSTAVLDGATAAAHGVVIVPTLITIGSTVYRDDEVPLPELLERFDEGVTTSGPPPGAFTAAVEGAEDGAVILTVSADLSSTYRAATVGATGSGVDVRVVDTGTAAGALALTALHAARVAATGASLDRVEAEARRAVAGVRLVGALETVEYLVRGGRINGVVGGLAARLGIRPLFELSGGNIKRLRPAFSRSRALDRLFRLWKRSRVEGARLHVAALHALAPESAARLLDRVRAEVEPETALIAEFGAVMVVHSGPHLTALSWWWDPEP
jgi:DegV family protein with EDD domain